MHYPCRTCDLVLPEDRFYRNRANTNRGQRDGQCIECKRVARREFYEANRERLTAKNREWGRSKAHGLAPGQYEQMLQDQSGRCGICGLKPSGQRLYIDHDHRCCDTTKRRYSCGKCVRALLCAGCNTKVAARESDIWPLVDKYVEMWQEKLCAATSRP